MLAPRLSSQSVGTGSSQTTPTSRPRILLVSVTKNALPWVPMEMDKPTDVALEDRVIEKKLVREEKTRRAHLVRLEMHKPITLHPIRRLRGYTIDKPGVRAASAKKMPETIRFERKKPQEMNIQQVCDSHKLVIEKKQVSLIKTKEIKKEDLGRQADTVRAQVTKAVEKPPRYEIIADDT